jgi:lysophospholipase
VTILAFDRRAIPASARVTQWQAPDGWPLRRFDWPAAAGTPPRGSILFQTGRGDLFEKYLETFDHWHRQGWSVTAFDWRGQGGSARLTPRAHCGHIERFEHYIDDLAAFHAAWIRETPGPHVLMGHSMGGHLVLRGLVERRVRPDAAVLIAPMLGLHSPLGQGERLARLLGGLGDPSRPAWKGNEKPYTTETRENLLTNDRARYEDELWWQQHAPALVTGPPSWRWVIEAFRSTRELRADPRLATMDVPLLLLVAERDGLVSAKAALATVGRLPDAQILRFGKESAHEILREADPVRDRALAEIDGFLAARAPVA